MVSNITPINNTSKEIDVYVPFSSADTDFGEEALVPVPEYMLLQYATGLDAHRLKVDKEGFQVFDENNKPEIDEFTYKGFFVQVGRDKELDAVMEARGVPRLFITHGKGEVVEHWEVGKPTVFLIAKGIPSNTTTSEEYGMPYVWINKLGITTMSAQVIIKQLLSEYAKPFVITFKSTQSGDILKAIRKQYKVLAFARQALRSAGRDIALPLWAYSLTLGPSKTKEARGQGSKVSMIHPVVSAIPDEITSTYLKNNEVPLEYADFFKEYTANSVEWAKGSIQRIVSGDDPQEPWQNGNSNGSGNADDKKLNETPF